MTELMFERLLVEGLFLAEQPLLALSSLGKLSGCVGGTWGMTRPARLPLHCWLQLWCHGSNPSGWPCLAWASCRALWWTWGT